MDSLDSNASCFEAGRTAVYFQSDRESSVKAWAGAIAEESPGSAVEERQQDLQQARVQLNDMFKFCLHTLGR